MKSMALSRMSHPVVLRVFMCYAFRKQRDNIDWLHPAKASDNRTHQHEKHMEHTHISFYFPPPQIHRVSPSWPAKHPPSNWSKSSTICLRASTKLPRTTIVCASSYWATAITASPCSIRPHGNHDRTMPSAVWKPVCI